jgi:hypothetical protein
MPQEAFGDNVLSQSKAFFYGKSGSLTDERLSTKMSF